MGAGVAEVYAAAFPTAALLAVVAGILAFAARSRASLVVASLALAAAAAGVAGDAATRAAAVRLAAERVLVTAIPLVLWGGLAMFRRGPDLALVAPLAFAVTVALQLHPRPDFLHLVSVAPVLLPLAARLMRDAAARLGGVRAIRGLAAATAVVALARLVPALGTASAILRGHVEAVPVGDVVLGGGAAGGAAPAGARDGSGRGRRAHR